MKQSHCFVILQFKYGYKVDDQNCYKYKNEKYLLIILKDISEL